MFNRQLVLLLFCTVLWAAPKQSEHVVLQLKWLHQFQFAGYYAAKEKGFYEAAGLDVEIRERDPKLNNIEQVKTNEAQYGIADSVLLLYQARKEPVVLLAPIFQHSPNVLISLAGSGLDSPYKLEGRSVAFYPKDTDGFGILAMFQELGIKPDLKYYRQKTDYTVLSSAETDLYACYLTNEPYFYYKSGIDINIINPANYGFDLYGDMLFTNKQELDNHPERVEKFKEATLQGWRYALKHKEEIINLIQTKYGSKKSKAHLMYEANALETMIEPNLIPIGTLDRGRLEYIQRLFIKHRLIDKKIPLDEYIYTPPKRYGGGIYLSEKEKAWLQAHPHIRLGIDREWAPFEFVDAQQHYMGLAAEYIGEIEKMLGIRFEIDKVSSWNETVSKMKERKLDMYSCAVKTEARTAYTDFTLPYLNFPMVILTGDNIAYLEGMRDLEGKTVAVVKEYISHELLREHHPRIKLHLVDTVTEGLEAVSRGEAYAYIGNLPAISYAIKESGLSNLKISGQTPYRFELAMAARNDWPILRGILQKALDAIDSEKRREIYNRWITIEFSHSFDYTKALWIIVPLLLIIALILIYTRKLKAMNTEVRRANDNLETVQTKLKQKNNELRMLSITDKLTGIYNRHHLDTILTQEIERATRHHRKLSIIMFDLDNFKAVNDRCGHQCGDQVLRTTAKIIQSQIRINDTFGRWGGEEFLLICPETDAMQVYELAEKLRLALSTAVFETIGHQSASFGTSSYLADERQHDFISRCDAALYRAKTEGKNCVNACL